MSLCVFLETLREQANKFKRCLLEMNSLENLLLPMIVCTTSDDVLQKIL